jgi:pyrimidine operon attenuation protein / uracil phosphoribosyltransferase
MLNSGSKHTATAKGLDTRLRTTRDDTLAEKRVVLSAAQLQRTIERLAQQIIEPNGASKNLLLIGIRKGGENLVRRIHAEIKRRTGVDVPVGFLNINLYRDDAAQRELPESDIADDVAGKEVVMVDDVLFTGRTIRSALDAITDMGRPKAARLCILVDRGLRELPIQADYCGRFVPTSRSEHVGVELHASESDADRVVIYGPK